jgi:hypothetical protein
MGYETVCRVRVDDRAGSVREAQGKVLLETDVSITSPSAVITLTLSPDAAVKWQKKLEQPPKQRIDKLDIEPGAKVWLLGVQDASLESELASRTSHISRGRTARACDVVFVGVESVDQLDRIDRALAALDDDGAIWVVHPKGRGGVADTTIFGRAKALGLVYTKVARISDTHTAEKLVRPRIARGKRGG